MFFFISRAQQLTAHPIYVNMFMIKGVAELSTGVIPHLTTRGRRVYCGALISSVFTISCELLVQSWLGVASVPFVEDAALK